MAPAKLSPDRGRLNARAPSTACGSGRYLLDVPPSSRATSVPKAIRATYAAVTVLTDAVCAEHLDEDYRDLSRAMAGALCRKRPSPLTSGQPRTWACGIVHALGQVNFLYDKFTQPFMTIAELCAAFGVGQSTASAKAKAISNALRIGMMDAAWPHPSLIERNLLVWMAEVNGLIVDLREMPREVQVIAYEQGFIPYVPADRN